MEEKGNEKLKDTIKSSDYFYSIEELEKKAHGEKIYAQNSGGYIRNFGFEKDEHSYDADALRLYREMVEDCFSGHVTREITRIDLDKEKIKIGSDYTFFNKSTISSLFYSLKDCYNYPKLKKLHRYDIKN